MDWITDTIAIGNYLDAKDVDLIRTEGFRSAFSLDGTLKADDRSCLSYEEILVYRMIDGPGNDPYRFARAVDDLVWLVEQRPPVLVQCHAGRSRSVLLVAGFLMRTCGVAMDEAIAMIAEKREVALTPGIEGLLSIL